MNKYKADNKKQTTRIKIANTTKTNVKQMAKMMTMIMMKEKTKVFSNRVNIPV